LAHLTYAVIEKVISTKELTIGEALILINKRHEPYSENLTQGQMICLGLIVPKVFLKETVAQVLNCCTKSV